MIDLRKDNLYALAGYNSDSYILNIQNESYKLTSEQMLMLHNMITNALQDEVNQKGGVYYETKRSDKDLQ